MYVEPIEVAGRSQITQPLQGWTNQGGAAIAIVDELAVRGEGQTVRGNARAEGGMLTGNGVIVGLLLRGDPGINGSLEIAHGPSSSPPCGSAAGRLAPGIGSSPDRRRAIGTACSYA